MTVHGAPLQFAVVDGRAYVHAPAAAYQGHAAPAAASKLAGRWVRLPRRSASLAELEDVSSLEGLLDAALTAHGEVYSAGDSSVDGKPAVRLRDARGGSLYVAADGVPYPLAIEAASGDSRLELTDWNEPVRVNVPPSPMDLEAARTSESKGQP